LTYTHLAVLPLFAKMLTSIGFGGGIAEIFKLNTFIILPIICAEYVSIGLMLFILRVNFSYVKYNVGTYFSIN